MSLANISIEELFSLLDVNRDKELSRTELHQGAQRLGWHWYHAPLYAVLDLLTICSPLSKNTFISYMNQILRDPDGPYGRILLHSELFTNPPPKLIKSFCWGGSGGAVFSKSAPPSGAGSGCKYFIRQSRVIDHRSPAFLYFRGVDAIHRHKCGI
jgi:hypothetical protein